MTNSLIAFGDSVGSLPIFEDARREIAEAETTDRIKTHSGDGGRLGSGRAQSH
jgi:hypothetical protein